MIVTTTRKYKDYIVGVTCDSSLLHEPLMVGQVTLPDDVILQTTLIPGPEGFTGSKYVRQLRRWYGYIAHLEDKKIDISQHPGTFYQEDFTLEGRFYRNGVLHLFDDLQFYTSERLFVILTDLIDNYIELPSSSNYENDEVD